MEKNLIREIGALVRKTYVVLGLSLCITCGMKLVFDITKYIVIVYLFVFLCISSLGILVLLLYRFVVGILVCFTKFGWKNKIPSRAVQRSLGLKANDRQRYWHVPLCGYYCDNESLE